MNTSNVRSITSPPNHHFFGYYDMNPWDPSGRYHLVLEVGFRDRPPGPDDEAVIMAVDLQEGNRLVPVARTTAWNFQQGTMLHWWPLRTDTVLFNTRHEGRFVCMACTLGGEPEPLGPATAALSEDGRFAATLNFARIAVTRPGYGYAGLDDAFASEALPKEDGLGLLDCSTGEYCLLVAMADLAPHQPEELLFGESKVWFNHVLFSPSGERLAFLCRWVPSVQGLSWWSQMWTVNRDGTGLRRVLDGPGVSHFDFRDEETLTTWAQVNGEWAMWDVDPLAARPPRKRWTGIITEDSHISYSHDRRWTVNDTYPDAEGFRELYLVEVATGERVRLGRFSSPRVAGMDEIRCDVHPSWRADDRQIAFDGIHEGTRQRYVLDIEI